MELQKMFLTASIVYFGSTFIQLCNAATVEVPTDVDTLRKFQSKFATVLLHSRVSAVFKQWDSLEKRVLRTTKAELQQMKVKISDNVRNLYPNNLGGNTVTKEQVSEEDGRDFINAILTEMASVNKDLEELVTIGEHHLKRLQEFVILGKSFLGVLKSDPQMPLNVTSVPDEEDIDDTETDSSQMTKD